MHHRERSFVLTRTAPGWRGHPVSAKLYPCISPVAKCRNSKAPIAGCSGFFRNQAISLHLPEDSAAVRRWTASRNGGHASESRASRRGMRDARGDSAYYSPPVGGSIFFTKTA